MDLRQLRYFVTVASERNFTRAAEKLHIAQPPLSRSIRQLEDEVGAVMFDRQSRPLRLTAIGMLFHEQALQLLGRMDAMQAMMKAAMATERTRFTIGFVASTIYARLPDIIREFRARSPDLELALIECSTLEQIAALKDGRIDVGFGRIRFDDPSIRRTMLREEQLVVALPLQHTLARQDRPVSLQEIAAEPLIIYPRTPRPSYADQVITLFRDHGHEPHIVHEARELQIAIGLVAAEEGVAIVPESISHARSHEVVYRALSDPATSPIFMSQRLGDNSFELQLMAAVICERYAAWGYRIPSGLTAPSDW